jgi:phytoene synthase
MALLHPDVIAAARGFEFERYIAATLVPDPKRRAALIAVAAFAGELRRIPEVVKEPMMGEVRLQWWRDVIESFGSSGSTGHPVADALAGAVQAYRLPILQLVAMTEVRAFDLYNDPMPDEASFLGYLAKTEAIPFSLAMQIMRDGHEADASLAHFAGGAFGLARMLASLPHWLARGRIPLPVSQLREHAVSEELLLLGVANEKEFALVGQIARDCKVTFDAFVSRFSSLHSNERLAFLPLAVVPTVLARVTAPGRDPLRSPVELAPLSRVLRIARARWLGL